VPFAMASRAVLQIGDGLRLLDLGDSRLTPVATVDGSRAAATVRGSGVPLDAPVTPALLRGRLGAAASLVGLARRQLELTVAYVRDRHQFGAPVGSFQAVKHPMADALVGIEFAWPAVIRAAQSMTDGEPDVAIHVAMAKALASDAAYRVSRVCLQAHGAIGYTTEYDLHLFAKRTWALVADWGASGELREQIAEHLGIPERTN
jgi:alkylation response protein AidB-like acyl-CoA dehydrogenase